MPHFLEQLLDNFGFFLSIEMIHEFDGANETSDMFLLAHNRLSKEKRSCS